MRSVELFAGAGGLALGASRAGFEHEAVIEFNHEACETIRKNQILGIKHVRDWNLEEANVRTFNFKNIKDDIDLLAAGVPCQPWSIGGKHRGYEDERNLFPDTIRAVLDLTPKAIIIENVRGLTRQTFADYFTYIQFMLEFPEVRRRDNEDWMCHRRRLEKYVTSRGKGYSGLRYNVVPKVLNAANFGIPQKRERVFIVCFRSDIGARWSFPDKTHSEELLLKTQWVTGEYWERHEIPARKRPKKPSGIEERLRDEELFEGYDPWVTVRDALKGLPDPRSKEASGVPNHIFQPGARPYVGHTGSPLDEPAKTLKAGDHGVPGGENMIAFEDGSVRYFTVREAALIQTFPRDFEFASSWSENMRQIGNAVPVDLANLIARSVVDTLLAARERLQ
ncbi:MAG TPA: DNA cytosine methyltransferase [Bryobacteraceae bacterium]|nr:DNA cytosine methyltransferase [Bryobacteraceae bacterium]